MSYLFRITIAYSPKEKTNMFRQFKAAPGEWDVIQGEETCMSNALSEVLVGIGGFIQHQRSGLKSSTQVTGCDSKVLAK